MERRVLASQHFCSKPANVRRAGSGQSPTRESISQHTDGPVTLYALEPTKTNNTSSGFRSWSMAQKILNNRRLAS